MACSEAGGNLTYKSSIISGEAPPDVVLHVPGKAVSREAVHEPGDGQVLSGVQLKLVQAGVLVVDVVLVVEEGDRPQRLRDAVPELLWGVVGLGGAPQRVLQRQAVQI